MPQSNPVSTVATPLLSSIKPAAAGLKILHVVRQFHPNRGGLEDFVANLAREQVLTGCDVRILTCDRLFSHPEHRLPAQAVFDGMKIQRLPFYGSTRYPLVPSLLRHLGDADILHVHAIDFFFDALALTRPLHRKPLVATTHGGFFHTADHAGLKRLWFNGPTRLSARAYGAIVGCSESDARQFSQIAGEKVLTIENGVDLSKFSGSASGNLVRSIVTVGRFTKNKRLDRLIAMASELRKRNPAWHLHIAGIPSDLGPSDLQGMIDATGVASNVTVHVDLTDSDLRALFARASFFVSASEYEGFGIALIEAMSAGFRCFVHPNASFRTLAARHPSVRLADFSDPAEVADMLEAAYGHPEASGMPDLSDHAWSGVAERYRSVYLGLV
jgi:alpha-1,3-mannosyltransferase